MAVRLKASEKILYNALIKAEAQNIADEFLQSGLPNRKNESYHYSDLKLLLDNIPDILENGEFSSEPEFNIAGAYNIFINNGRVEIAKKLPKDVEIGTISGTVFTPENDIVAKLNSALSKESLQLEIKGNLENIIYIEHRSNGQASFINDNIEIELLANANAIIIEIFTSSNNSHLSNHASRINLAENSNLTHIVLDLSAKENRHLYTLTYEVEKEARLNSLIIHKGANLARTQLFAKFVGENSHADFSGLTLAESEQHSDISINISHAVANTSSSENYKSVVRDRAKGIFQGKILVERDAQKIDAKMMHKGLMLSDDAQILVKPELEIYADDVICGHGATCGELDKDSLFYLMSRGIAYETARAMLIKAFLAEIFDFVENKNIHEILQKLIDDWLN